MTKYIPCYNTIRLELKGKCASNYFYCIIKGVRVFNQVLLFLNVSDLMTHSPCWIPTHEI